jgi:hypothetical protein
MRIILLLLILVGGSAYGQLKKGSFMIGGSMGFSSSSTPSFNGTTGRTENVKATSVSCAPAIRYFLIDNLAAGITLSINGSNTKASYGKGSSFGIQAGPTVRYYFPFGKFAVFPTIAATWGKDKSKTDFVPSVQLPDNEVEWSTATYAGGVGLAWFIANNVSIDGILYYQSNDTGIQNSDTDPVNSVIFNVGIQVFIPAKGSN